MQADEDEPVVAVEAKNDMTPAEVAHNCGVKTADVMRLNRERYRGLKVDSKLQEGTQLLIPIVGGNSAGSQAPSLAAADDDDGCRVCHSLEHADQVLLCDECDLQYHIFCLSPPLSAVPWGEWFCPTCRYGLRCIRNRTNIRTECVWVDSRIALT